ncbi:MAG: dephospho-CoA kinase [Rickettsiales bacterium]|nr:dephospho-CoA kinase [Rickettsiales bacterium]
MVDKKQKICLTGPPKSGKTTLLKLAKNKGFQTFSCDDVAHQIKAGDKSVVKSIEAKYTQKKVYKNRGKKPTFGVKTADFLHEMEQFLHPLIQGKLRQWIEENSNEKRLLVEVPLVFEVQWQNMFDEIWFVDLMDSDREKRNHPSDKWPEELKTAILNRHLPTDQKKKLSDRVITTREQFLKLLLNDL